MATRLPAHVIGALMEEPPNKVIQISRHGYREEMILVSSLKDRIQGLDPSIRVADLRMLDAELYIILSIGASIAGNILYDLLKYSTELLRDRWTEVRKPVIYICSSLLPKEVYRLPEEADEALDYLRRFNLLKDQAKDGGKE